MYILEVIGKQKNITRRRVMLLFLFFLTISLTFNSFMQFVYILKADVGVVYWSETWSSFVIPENASLSVKNATVIMDINVKNLTRTHYIYNVSIVANFTIRGTTANRTNYTLGFIYPSMWNAFGNNTYSNLTAVSIYANNTQLNYIVINGSELKTNNKRLSGLLDELQVFVFNVSLSMNETILTSVMCSFFASSTNPEYWIHYVIATASTWKENTTEIVLVRIKHPEGMPIGFYPKVGKLERINATYLEYLWEINKTLASEIPYLEVRLVQYPYEDPHFRSWRPTFTEYMSYILLENRTMQIILSIMLSAYVLVVFAVILRDELSKPTKK